RQILPPKRPTGGAVPSYDRCRIVPGWTPDQSNGSPVLPSAAPGGHQGPGDERPAGPGELRPGRLDDLPKGPSIPWAGPTGRIFPARCRGSGRGSDNGVSGATGRRRIGKDGAMRFMLLQSYGEVESDCA